VQNIAADMAHVKADGTVHWKRMGGLKAICAFTGLEPIPFDTLSCTLEFGSLKNRNMNYYFLEAANLPGPPGLTFGGFPSEFQEFSLVIDRSETFTKEYPNYHALGYTFYFTRAQNYYVMKIIVPTIMFTCLSFGMFLLDQRVGERLGFGVSILLVMVAQSIVTADMLPIAKPALWIDSFALWSYYWVVIAVFESVVVAYLYYAESEEEERKAEAKRLGEEEERNKDTEDKREMETRFDTENDATAENIEISIHDQNYSVYNDKSNVAKSNNGEIDASSKISDEMIPESAPAETKGKKYSGSSSLVASIVGEEGSSTSWRIRLVQKLDHYSLIVMPSSYLVYVILMFATAKHWAQN